MVPFEPIQLAQRFQHLRDPRISRTRRHEFVDLLMIAICGVLCGADNFVEMERFARSHSDWFATFLSLPSGIPSHDTLARLFARLDPVALAATLSEWSRSSLESSDSVATEDHEDTIAVDGKCLRASFDKASGSKALQLISAWSTRTNLVLAQQRIEDKSNEITAVAPMLDQIDIAGSTVTLDALNTQKDIAHYLRERQAHYVLALKLNHPRLHGDVTAFFDQAKQRGFWTDEGERLPHGSFSTRNNDHGRLETRVYTCAPAPAWLDGYDEWPDLKTIVRVERTRQIGANIAIETTHYISSLPLVPAKLARAIRSHWSIENSLHWILDIAFGEDRSRTRNQHAGHNMATLRRFTLGLLKAETTAKVGINAKRKTAGWDENYRAKLIMQLCS